MAGVSLASLAGTIAPASAATRSRPVLRARIDSTWYARDAVLQWEARRIPVAAAKLRGNAVGALLGDLDALILRPAVGTREIARARNQLVETKLAMGQKAIRDALAVDLAASGLISPLSALPSSWTISHALVRSDRGTAQGLVRWFRAMTARNDLRAGLVACPDHYRVATLADGRQDVIEVTGGATLATQFRVNYSDPSHVSVPANSAYRYGVAGSASTVNGTLIGSVRHQARNLATGGFEASLNVAFPSTLPPWFISEHRWHLACEWSNWIEAYLRDARL
jgi:hypothetical protein